MSIGAASCARQAIFFASGFCLGGALNLLGGRLLWDFWLELDIGIAVNDHWILALLACLLFDVATMMLLAWKLSWTMAVGYLFGMVLAATAWVALLYLALLAMSTLP